MGKFFSSKFFEGITKATDVMLIGFYFLLCSLPIFTIGASLSGLYYSTHKCIFKNKGYTTEFFRSFKDNFKQATLSWLIYLILFCILGADILITRSMIDGDSIMGGAPIFFLVIAVFVMLWMIYHFAYIARFSDTFTNSFKVSGAFMFANLGWTFIILAIMFVAFLLMYRFPILLVFAPGVIAAALHPIMERIFRKYMSPEDLAKEDEDLVEA